MFHTVRSYFYVLHIYRLFSHFTYIAILLLIFLLLICRSSFKGGGTVSETRLVNTLPRYFCSASFLELCDQKTSISIRLHLSVYFLMASAFFVLCRKEIFLTQ